MGTQGGVPLICIEVSAHQSCSWNQRWTDPTQRQFYPMISPLCPQLYRRLKTVPSAVADRSPSFCLLQWAYASLPRGTGWKLWLQWVVIVIQTKPVTSALCAGWKMNGWQTRSWLRWQTASAATPLTSRVPESSLAKRKVPMAGLLSTTCWADSLRWLSHSIRGGGSLWVNAIDISGSTWIARQNEWWINEQINLPSHLQGSP